MTTLDLDTLLQRDSNLFSAPMDGDQVMMSAEANAYYGLRGIDPRIWEMLEQPISLRQLTARLCEEFDVDETTWREDAAEFIQQLLRANVVRIAG